MMIYYHPLLEAMLWYMATNACVIKIQVIVLNQLVQIKININLLQYLYICISFIL